MGFSFKWWILVLNRKKFNCWFLIQENYLLEDFRNEILLACLPVSLSKTKCWNYPYFWICEFRNKNHFRLFFVEVLLIFEFMNSKIRITSIFRSFWQANMISFRKNLYCHWNNFGCCRIQENCISSQTTYLIVFLQHHFCQTLFLALVAKLCSLLN